MVPNEITHQSFIQNGVMQYRERSPEEIAYREWAKSAVNFADVPMGAKFRTGPDGEICVKTDNARDRSKGGWMSMRTNYKLLVPIPGKHPSIGSGECGSHTKCEILG
jgi:hypothetical protein